MDKNQIDILLLVDTRLTATSKTLNHAIAQTKHKYRIIYKPQNDVDHKHRVGGVLIAYNERITHPSLTKLCPAGSTSILNFRFGRRKMHAIATYWPLHNIDERSLWSRMKMRSDEEGIYSTPIEYIQAMIASRITEFTYANETCFLFGDFNTDVSITNANGVLTHDKYDLATFVHATQLIHSSSESQLKIQSYGGIARYTSGKGCSRIDYQFHNDCNIKKATCFPNDTLFDIGTMHRILFANYDLTEYTPNRNNLRYYRTIRNVNLRNERLVKDISEQYQEMFTQLQPIIDDTSIPPTDKLDAITKQSVDIVQKSTSAIRPQWNVYSPQAHATFLELKYVRKMAIFCYSPSNNIRWSSTTYKAQLNKLLREWKYQLRKHTRQREDLYQELYKLHVESYGIQYWTDKSLLDIKCQVKDAIITIKKRLHCRRRQSMRMRFNDKVREIENERKEGRVKNLITMVFGSRKKNNTFDYIIKDGEVITDERKVAAATKDFFEHVWFKALPDDGTHISNNLEDYTIFELPFDEFQNHFKAAGIPEHVLRTLHEAIQQKPSAEKCQAMQEVLMKEPTFIEFMNILKKKKVDSMAGRSGLSYNMIELWPKELKRAVFDILLELWKADISPQYWKIEMIYLIPKANLPELDKLRPITLLETLRKIWLAITTTRMQEQFATGGYLHTSQHGCLKKVGVDEANLGVINQYESSKELTSELYTVFWDKKRAFDRPPKPALYYALRRMAAILKVAKYYVEMGIDGTTYIKTPLLTKAMVQNRQDIIDQQAFTKETGTPQGDTPSALMWNVFEDILLVAISKCKEGRASFPTHDGQSITQESSAFVDDLTSFAGTYEGIQAEADIISAFCIIFGIELSIPKLRASRLQWGNAHIPGRDKILVHTAGWVPHEIELENDGFYKTLGMTIDADPLSITQNNIVRQQILTALALVLKAPVSSDSKLALIKVSLYPKCLYTAKLAAWTLEQYRELDKLFEKAFRKIAKCMPTTATALLYMKTTSGGLGLPQFSTLCNKRKLRLLMRLDQQQPYRRHIVQSLLGRGARAQGIVIPAGHGATIDKPMQQWWITSLLQELAELNLTIHIHGHHSTQNIYQWDVQKPATGKLATKAYNDTIGISTNKESSHEELFIPLRTAQVWAIKHETSTEIKEIIGFSQNYTVIEYMLWLTNDPITPGAKVTLSMHNNPISPYPVGAFGTHNQSYDDFFPTTSSTQILVLSAETHDNNRLNITSTILQVKTKRPARPQAFSPQTHIFEEIMNTSANAEAIMTDGGYDTNSIPTKQGGAVVLKHSAKLYTCINIIADIECKSVFPIELAALAIAKIAARSTPSNCIIHSDSQSSINTMKAIEKNQYQKTLLAYALNQPTIYSKNPIQWVQSHVEKRKRKWKDWTDAEKGNYVADKMTLRNWNVVPSETKLLNSSVDVRKVMDIQLSTFINCMQQHNSFSIKTTTGIYYDDIEDTKLTMMEHTYLKTRDEYRRKRHPGIQPYWVHKVPAVLRWTSRTPTTICEKAFRMKIAYNKHWTTGNRYRYTNIDTNCECPNCGQSIETTSHIIFDCPNIAMATLRQQLFNQINQLIIRQKKKHPLLSPIIDHLRESAYDTTIDRHRNNYWKGLWSVKQIKAFRDKISHPPYQHKYKIHTIYKLSRIYTDAARQLYGLRGQLISNKDSINHPLDIQNKVQHYSKKITDFFNDDFEKKKKIQNSNNVANNKEQCLNIKTIEEQIKILDNTTNNIMVDNINDDNYHLAATHYNLYASNLHHKRVLMKSANRIKRKADHEVKKQDNNHNHSNTKNDFPPDEELIQQIEPSTSNNIITGSSCYNNVNPNNICAIKQRNRKNDENSIHPEKIPKPNEASPGKTKVHPYTTVTPSDHVLPYVEPQVRLGIG
jgi:hypothetical protein